MIKGLKRAQEEMVGFALIIVLVSVILLAFLFFSLSKAPEPSPSYEVDNFIQAFLQHTTNCGDSREFFTIQDLIFECEVSNECLDGRNSCDVLNESLNEILEGSWPVGEQFPEKGYELTINTETKPLIELKEGIVTSNYKGSDQTLSKRRETFNIAFRIYN